MDEKKGTETIVPVIPPVEPAAPVGQDDAEAKIAALEAEKATILEREANYKLAYLKERKKNEGDDPEESEEDRIARIVAQQLSEKRVGAIDAEKEALLKKLAKENKELKLAQLNKTNTPPASVGTHGEGQTVKDTSVTPEQLAAFKAKGWTEKDIERYKSNLKKYGGR